MAVDIEQLLPEDVYDALVAANAPTTLNPYATIADLAGLGENWGNTNLLVDANRTHNVASFTLTENNVGDYTTNLITTAQRQILWNDGDVTPNSAILGVGVSPTGFEAGGGVGSYYDTGGGTKGYSSIYDFGGDTYIQHTLYNSTFAVDEAGFFARPSVAGGNFTAAQLYHLEYGSGNYYGFEANVFGERILSQSAGLNRLSSIDASAGMAFLSGSGGTGYIGVVDQTGFIDWMGASWPAADGNGIYDGNGTIPNNTTSTVTGNFILATPLAADRVVVGTVASPSFKLNVEENIQITNPSGNAQLNVSSGGGASFISVDSTNASFDASLRFRGADGGFATKTTIGWDSSASLFRMGTTSVDAGVFYEYNPSLTQGRHVQSLGIGGTFPGSTTRLAVRGGGTTNLTTTVRFEGSTGVDHFVLQDDGHLAFYSGGNASFVPSFGSYFQSAGYATGFAFYGRTGTTNTMSVQHTGAGSSPIVLDVAFQGAITSGIATAIRGNGLVTGGASRTIGVYGLSRNGTNNSVGVYAQIGGGFTVTPSAYVAGLQAESSTNVDVEQRAGDFIVAYNNSGLDYTNDLIAVNAVASGTLATGGAGSTADIIAGRFRTTGDQGTGDRIALLVPSTNNNGVTVLGADSRDGDSQLQVTGEMELFGDGAAWYMYSPDGTRWTITIDNGGSFVIV